jgi:hypothetical protein
MKEILAKLLRLGEEVMTFDKVLKQVEKEQQKVSKDRA